MYEASASCRSANSMMMRGIMKADADWRSPFLAGSACTTGAWVPSATPVKVFGSSTPSCLSNGV